MRFQIGQFISMILVLLSLGACSIKGGEVTSEVFNSKAFETLSDVTIAGYDPSAITYTQSNLLTISGQCLTGATIEVSGDISTQLNCDSGSFSGVLSATKVGLLKFKIFQKKSLERSAGLQYQWMRDPVPPTIASWNDGVTAGANLSPTYSMSVIDADSGIEKIEVAVVTDLSQSSTASWSTVENATSGAVSGTYILNTVYYTLLRVTDRSGNVTQVAGDGWINLGTLRLTSPSANNIYSMNASENIQGDCVEGSHIIIDSTNDSLDQNITCSNTGTFQTTLTQSTESNLQFTIHEENSGTIGAAIQFTRIYDVTSPSITAWLDGTAAIVAMSPSYQLTSSDSGSGILQNEVAVGTTSGGTDVVGWTSIGTATSGQVSAPTGQQFLTDTVYYTSVKVTDRAGNSTIAYGDGWAILTTPVITSPISLGVTTSSHSTTIDGQCWTGAIVTFHDSVDQTQLCIGGTFSFNVSKASDGQFTFNIYQSQFGSNSDSVQVVWTIDTTAPIFTTAVNDGVVATATTSPTYSFAASDSGVGIDHYEVAVGTNSGSTDVVNWTNIGNSTSGIVNGSFALNVPYYTSIKVIDVLGNSVIQSGDGWIRLSEITISSPSLSTVITNTNTLTIGGTCTNGTVVHIDGDGTLNDKDTNCSSGLFSESLMLTTDGANTFLIYQSAYDSQSNGVSFSWVRDTVAPVFSGTLDDGINTLTATSSPTYAFSAATDSGGSGIDHYEVAVGSTAGGSDVATWTNISIATTGTVNLSLTYGSTYYTSIKAVDVAGNISYLLGNGWTYLYSEPNTLALPTNVPEGYPYAGNVIKNYSIGGETFSLDSSTCQGLSIDSNSGFISGVIGLPAGSSCQFKVKLNFSGGFHISTFVNLNITTSLTLSFSTDFIDVKKGNTAQVVTLQLKTPAPFATSFVYSLYSLVNDYSLLNTFAGVGFISIPQGTTSVPLNIEYLSSNSFSQIDWQTLQLDSGAKMKPSLNLRFHQVSVPPNFSLVSTSKNSGFNCGIANSQLYCWGENNYGQLGTGDFLEQRAPKLIDSGNQFAQVSVGGSHACAITTTNVLKCWGLNNNGQVGDNSIFNSSSPVTIESGTSFVAVSAGFTHTCAITSAQELKCWGSNSYGQLGIGSTPTQQLTPIVVESGVTYQSVSAGNSHSCGLTGANKIKCWGNNLYGQIGDTTTSSNSSPVAIDQSTSYQAIISGAYHNCALVIGGGLKCWGLNNYGQVGDTFTGTNSLSPTLIDSGIIYQVVSAGDYHTCGITNSNVLKCWGFNLNGQLADGTTSNQNGPVIADSGINYTSISAGNYRTCGVRDTGKLYCWGQNIQNQLGLSIANSTKLSKHTIGNQNYIQSSGGGTHSCAISVDGVLKCWGLNIYGQIGDGTSVSRITPIVINAGVGYKKISTSDTHTCGITTDDVLKCWGRNVYGQLGNGTTTSSSLPIVIDSGVNYQQISVGYGYSCGVTTDGILKCWGANLYGQLGIGSSPSQQTTPYVVDIGTSYSNVNVRYQHTCGITTTGVLKCWGTNTYYQLGDGTTIAKNTPTPVFDNGTTYSFVSVGFFHTCGITTSGVLKCWGGNSSGQLGDSTSTQRSSPVVIDLGTVFTSISLGNNHSCGITNSGILKCWGSNMYGQLGDGSTTNTYTPVVIDSGTYFQKLSSGNNHTCAITNSGTLKCWGENSYGQSLSMGSSSIKPTPIIELIP